MSWLPIITNLGSLSQIRLNEYQPKSISFNYNICGIWKIFNNTRQRKYGLKDIIDYIDQEDEEAILVFLDQQKAFDKVEWGWVDYILKEFNFGENLRGWIKMLFKGKLQLVEQLL